MELIQHTQNWVKGELLGSISMGVMGFLIVAAGLLLWRYGTTPYAKAMIIPLLIVGMIPFVMGIAGSYTNSTRMTGYEQQWQADKSSFVASEKERVEGFDNIFKFTYPMAAIFTIGGAILFFVFSSATLKSICLAVMILGMQVYVLDYFAAQRAETYLQYIDLALLKK